MAILTLVSIFQLSKQLFGIWAILKLSSTLVRISWLYPARLVSSDFGVSHLIGWSHFCDLSLYMIIQTKTNTYPDRQILDLTLTYDLLTKNQISNSFWVSWMPRPNILLTNAENILTAHLTWTVTDLPKNNQSRIDMLLNCSFILTYDNN